MKNPYIPRYPLAFPGLGLPRHHSLIASTTARQGGAQLAKRISSETPQTRFSKGRVGHGAFEQPKKKKNMDSTNQQWGT